MPNIGELSKIWVCSSDKVKEAGTGVRFSLMMGREEVTAFVVRKIGKVCGYVNRCAHVAMELDWNLGEFFDSTGNFLICATHGALYEPLTGKCVEGPCLGASLYKVEMCEEKGAIFWLPNYFLKPVVA
jgi:nitrite reductase/ring-hydroxylating ferredoxin subunit